MRSDFNHPPTKEGIMKNIVIAPNRPLFVSLADPQQGTYDFDHANGLYHTTTGETISLPRPAVILLNLLEPKPGEEIVITKHWDGLPASPEEWTIALSTSSEKARAEAGEPDSLTRAIEKTTAPPRSPIEAPRPIRKAPIESPGLFDARGTGTHGPAPIPQFWPAGPVAAPARGRQKLEPIPANIAVREILAFIAADPGTLNWGAEARQDLASTVIIAAYKAGHIGLWERGK
jgi:hypothetical protein